MVRFRCGVVLFLDGAETGHAPRRPASKRNINYVFFRSKKVVAMVRGTKVISSAVEIGHFQSHKIDI